MFRRLPQVTQAKINALLEELRTWAPGETPLTLHELADKHGLDLFVVDRIVRSEGLKVPLGEAVVPDAPDEDADPNSTTLDLDPDEVRRALEKPDPSPDWVEDEDTGIWRRKPTGEWERVGKDD